MSYQLSPNFTLEEMATTGIRSMQFPNFEAARTSPEILTALFALTADLMQPVRDHFGPVSVHSGYRTKALNDAVGSSDRSQHLHGEACDFDIPGHKLTEVFDWLRFDSGLRFGQCILEGGPPEPRWLHLSLAANRPMDKCQQALIGRAGADGVFYYYPASGTRYPL